MQFGEENPKDIRVQPSYAALSTGNRVFPVISTGDPVQSLRAEKTQMSQNRGENKKMIVCGIQSGGKEKLQIEGD